MVEEQAVTEGSQRIVQVALGDRAYPVVVTDDFAGLGEALTAATGARGCVVVTDTCVADLWLEPVRAELQAAGLDVGVVVVPASEAAKHHETWWSIVDGLLTHGVDRRTPVVALGGGVIGDLAGFAAASTLRGLPVIGVPTTLLAMVDSSVGGKTGFNHPTGKNLVGAFHQPSLVWAALTTLTTLPGSELRSGLGEVVKTALLGDATLLAHLEANADALARGDASVLAPVVARCVAIKADVVVADEREGDLRAILNAGHTVGHAIEQVLGFGTWTHGEAVGVGLVVETAWAVRAGLCDDPTLPERIGRLLARLGLATALPWPVGERPVEALVAAMRVDKKAYGNTLSLPIAVSAGHMRLVHLPIERAVELVTT